MINNILIFLGLSLTIIALILAIWQLKQAYSQTLELNNIRKSLTTRFIGQFPSYLPQILKILENAKREITILCDVPAFAAFSDPKNGLKYRQIIESKIHDDVEVNYICLNEKRRMLLYKEQFGHARDNWTEWKNKSFIMSKIESMLKTDKISEKTIENISYNEFIDCLKKNDEKVLKYSFNGANSIIELNEDLKIYFWIVDGLYAVFAIPKFSLMNSGFVTSGFITSDHRLIAALISLRDWYFGKNKVRSELSNSEHK